MKPPPEVGSSAIVLISHSQWPVLSGVLPETSQAHGRKSRTTWLQDMGVHQPCRQLRSSGWRQDRTEPRTGCLPSVTVLSQRRRNCWCLVPCAAPEQQEPVQQFKNSIPNQGKCCCLAYFSNCFEIFFREERKRAVLGAKFP